MLWLKRLGICLAIIIRLEVEGWVVSPSAIGQIKTEELSKWINGGEKVTILDTRSAHFDDKKRLPGALSIPYNTPEGGIKQTLPYLDAKVVVYCGHAKCPASQYMAERLVRLGYKQVYRYPDGIKTWCSEGKPTELCRTIKQSQGS